MLAAFVLILFIITKGWPEDSVCQPLKIIFIFVGGGGEDWIACWGGVCANILR